MGFLNGWENDSKATTPEDFSPVRSKPSLRFTRDPGYFKKESLQVPGDELRPARPLYWRPAAKAGLTR